MKKICTLLIALAAVMFMTVTAQAAADYTNTAGDVLVIATPNMATDDMRFNPSPQVLIQVAVGAQRFCTTAAHAQAFNASGGKEYGMSYDSTKVYYREIGDDDTIVALYTLTDSDSTDLNAGFLAN